MNAHGGVTIFTYKYNVLMLHIPHDVDGLFSLMHKFLARSYDGYFVFCHAVTVSEVKRLANRFFERGIQQRPKKRLDKITSW